MQHFKSIFPFNQNVIAEYPLMDKSLINKCIAQSNDAFKNWKQVNISQRAEVLIKIAGILQRDKEIFAKLISHEMGKIIAEARAEIEKCALVCEYYATNAENFLKDEIIKTDYKKSFISYEPMGAVLAIMPWNFPFWQVFRFAAPTLMAGNVVLLKHAPNVCGCSLAIEKIFVEASGVENIFQSLIIDTPDVNAIISADIVQAVTLTGSENAGSSVAALAGKNIKKSVLELGGSDALIILNDADLQQAAKVAVQSRMQNAGQSCIAAKRFIVVENVYDDFINELINLIKKLRQGNPFEEDITTGPMARLDLAETLKNQMNHSSDNGANLLLGGDADGCNFTPALLVNVKQGMAAFEEETFGPLASVIKVKDEKEAIEIANQSRYGLAGSIWTRDFERGIAVAKKINSGAVYINSLVKSDPRLPFGGMKKSGYGRELGRNGILEFMNVKTIAAEEAAINSKENISSFVSD